jgi:transposase
MDYGAALKGGRNKDVGVRLGVSATTVTKWRRRAVAERLDGLRDEPRSGAPRTTEEARI